MDMRLGGKKKIISLLVCFNADFGLLSCELQLERCSALITQAADFFFS